MGDMVNVQLEQGWGKDSGGLTCLGLSMVGLVNEIPKLKSRRFQWRRYRRIARRKRMGIERGLKRSVVGYEEIQFM